MACADHDTVLHANHMVAHGAEAIPVVTMQDVYMEGILTSVADCLHVLPHFHLTRRTEEQDTADMI